MSPTPNPIKLNRGMRHNQDIIGRNQKKKILKEINFRPLSRRNALEFLFLLSMFVIATMSD